MVCPFLILGVLSTTNDEVLMCRTSGDSAAGTFPLLTELTYPDQAERQSLRVPTLCPKVSRIFLLLTAPKQLRHCTELSDNHTEASFADSPDRVLIDLSKRPKSIPKTLDARLAVKAKLLLENRLTRPSIAVKQCEIHPIDFNFGVCSNYLTLSSNHKASRNIDCFCNGSFKLS